jgi:hypothetical protein
VNHLESKAIQDAQDVEVGMFRVESYPAKVLFDIGATHSFVSASWVESHNIPIEPMIPPLRVNSVGGKVQSGRICSNLRIEIRGIAFPASLVVMGTQGLDVILGMNWLHINQATVSCDKRTIKLVSPSGKEVVTKLYLPKLEEGACHCWGLVLKCFELRTRQHKMLNVNALRPLKHYLPKGIMIFGRMS